ncbi:Protein bud22 [Cytospora mali]|uniref:Protein bud22 n=1 Tax=Cytospora mali TaxID=578113 RepID=A0A194VZ09_CYTMA|nr:Protein bud22 [Valsa mali]
MAKRKRSDLEEKLELHQTALFRALKVAKGFERQRMAKRQRDPKSNPEKKARIEKEVEVLKSLDLHSVANAHLCSSLLKIKAVAESPRLPDEVKNGVPKPEITEEERAALHNVTSGLYNQIKVKQALDKAIAEICYALHVPVPDKKGKQSKGDKKNETVTRKDPEEQPADRPAQPASAVGKKEAKVKVKDDISDEEADESSDEDETDWNGLSEGDEDEEEVEQVISRFNDRLGGSDSEGSDEEGESIAKKELDPMEITDESASEDSEGDISLSGSGSNEDDSEVSAEEESDSGSESGSDSDVSGIAPPPKVSRRESKKDVQAKSKTDRIFLPSLMGGYISNSESEASDIDVAPPARKNRRGQRARQAIWEKKFKEQAKHLAQEKSSRDDGWDLKRGAVDGSARTPWKAGVKTPFAKRTGGNSVELPTYAAEPQKPKAPRKKDNEGPLHPSWEARKKAKEAQETAVFQGKKITFD